MHSNKYAIFPFGQIERGARVVIYGAGRAGQNFFHQVRCSQYCNIVYVVDKDCESISAFGPDIKPIDALADTSEYDYCVISVLDKKIRKEVIDNIKSLGVSDEKIIIPTDNEFDWTWYGIASAEKEYMYSKNINEPCKGRAGIRTVY